MGSNAEPRLRYAVQADADVLGAYPALGKPVGWVRDTERVPPDNSETIILRYFMPPLLSMRSGGVLTIEENLVAIASGDGKRWLVNCAALSAHDRRYRYPRTLDVVGSETIVKQETVDTLRTLGYAIPEATGNGDDLPSSTPPVRAATPGANHRKKERKRDCPK